MYDIIILEKEPLLLDCYTRLILQIYPSSKIYKYTEPKRFLSNLESRLNLGKSLSTVIMYTYSLCLEKEEDLNEVKLIKRINCIARAINANVCVLMNFFSDYHIQSVFDVLTPNLFIVKNDIKDENFLLDCFSRLKRGSVFYSNTIERFLRRKALDQLFLEQKDRKILLLLQQNYTIREIALELAMSKSSIEKRKSKMIAVLGLKKNNNSELLRVAHSEKII